MKPEEEKYTNKVIEVFNAGLLKLGEHERGITLRAYLAEKLQCDPMRITKKYTGASCLGKRVYHFDYQHADHSEAERLRQELQILESNFRLKLEQMNRKKMNDHSNVDETYRISTPAIDALLQRNRAVPMAPHGYEDGMPPYSGYPPQFFGPPPNGYGPPHPQYIPMPSGLYGQILKEISQDSVPMDSGGDKKLPPQHPHMPQFFRGPNGEFFMQPPYPGPMPPYYMPMPPPAYMRMDHSQLSPPMDHPSMKFPSGSYLPPPVMGNIGRIPSWKDINAASIPVLPGGMPTSIPMSTSLPLPVQLSHNVPIVDFAKLEPKSKRPRLEGSGGSQTKLHRSPPIGGKNIAEDENLSKKIELSEVDQNEAASSLLGFINHVNRNGSQEDLVEFFEGVQKTMAKSPNVAPLTGSPPTPSGSMQRSLSYGLDLSAQADISPLTAKLPLPAK